MVWIRKLRLFLLINSDSFFPKLFENSSIKQEFFSCVKVQSQIKTQVLHDIQVLCNENKNSDL